MTIDPNVEYPPGYLDSGIDENDLASDPDEIDTVEIESFSEDSPEIIEVPTTDPSLWTYQTRVDASGSTVVDVYVTLPDIDGVNYEVRETVS